MTGEAKLTRVRVISLADAHDRREAFTARAAGAKVDWSFFDACTELHPGLSYDAGEVIKRLGRELSRGEIGCFSSHFALWEELERGEEKQLLVLEDDILLDWIFVERLCEFDLAENGLDYLRLSYKNPAPSILSQRSFVDRQHHLIELFGFAWGTQAYVITKQGARAFRKACSSIALPIDDQMDRSWDHGIPNHAIFPPVAIEESIDSTIGNGRFGNPAARRATTGFRMAEMKKAKRMYLAARLKRAIKRRLPGSR